MMKPKKCYTDFSVFYKFKIFAFKCMKKEIEALQIAKEEENWNHLRKACLLCVTNYIITKIKAKAK